MNGDAASIEAEYVRVLDGYRNFTESGKGVAVFCGNKAHMNGGGIKSDDYSITTVFDGSIHFESNTAMYGGGMYLSETSKLILSSSVQNGISFVLNSAYY